MEAHTETIFQEFIRYNNWANQQVIRACQGLSEEQLASTAPGAYGTIRDTLWHIIMAEADYVGRLTGSSPEPPFRREDRPTLASLLSYAGQVAGAMLDAAQRTPPDHIVHEEEDGNTIDYKAVALYIQVINHGIEHRTNVTTILSGLGLPAPEVDGWAYLFAHPGQFALKETFRETPNADHQP